VAGFMISSFTIAAMFFVSGAAGLMFEMAWFYRAGLALGSSVWAAAITASSFMGGLALGSALIGRARILRPLRVYALAEITLAAAGVMVVYALASSAPMALLARVPLGTVWAANAVRLGIAFLLLLVPASAMGMTLPLLVGELSRRQQAFAAALGRLYGWNTLGAVAGALLAEAVFIRHVGVTGTAWVAALFNIAAALAAVWLTRRHHAQAADKAVPASGQPSIAGRWSLHVAAALGGALLLGLEVVWFRFLSMFVLSTTLAMSIMLAVVLGGIGIGGLAASRWYSSRAGRRSDIATMAFIAGCLVVASYRSFQALTSGTQAGAWHEIAWFATVLALPTSLVSGVLFTTIGHAMSRRGEPAERTAAAVALANTLGAACGPLLASFVLLPALGMERTLFAAACGYVALAAIAVDRPILAGRRARVVAGAACAAALAVFPFGLMAGTYFDRAAAPYAADGSRIVATREGLSETILLMRQTWLEQPVYDRLLTNGVSMSGTAVLAERYMRTFVALPLILHEAPLRRALVIGYGVGVTVEAATDVPSIASIDVVEISPDIVAISDLIDDGRRRPLRDPRVHLHVEDGRFFLASTREQFDLITGEPPPPRTPAAANIYTREYFRLIREHLSDDGMATYWVPIARPNPGTDVSPIIAAFCDVFEDCSLWNATPFDAILLGSRRTRAPVSTATLSRPWTIAPLAASLRDVGFEGPEQVAATFLGDAGFAKELAGSAPPLTDDFPQRLLPDRRRFSLSDPRYGADSRANAIYRRTLDTDRARQAFESSPFVRRLFLPSFVADTLPWFAVQAVVNRVIWEGGRPQRLIEDLDAVLTQTSLPTLPLWMLGSDAVKQRIASHSGDRGGAVEYAKGLERLSARDYAGAASRLALAEQHGLREPEVRALLVYALCRAGNVAGAARLASGIEPRDPDAAHFWTWMHAQFGVGPAVH
jgi:predicted membrane-bound spermidine synthase